uniref:Uncharacterized protein n=1 Tax=Aegilops tauschii subsp. strangulata TaxID=200361 RepID=A0A453EWX1_AEGTS
FLGWCTDLCSNCYTASRITKLWGKTFHPAIKQKGNIFLELAVTKISSLS